MPTCRLALSPGLSRGVGKQTPLLLLMSRFSCEAKVLLIAVQDTGSDDAPPSPSHGHHVLSAHTWEAGLVSFTARTKVPIDHPLPDQKGHTLSLPPG